jgi:hypothetical protein
MPLELLSGAPADVEERRHARKSGDQIIFKNDGRVESVRIHPRLDRFAVGDCELERDF